MLRTVLGRCLEKDRRRTCARYRGRATALERCILGTDRSKTCPDSAAVARIDQCSGRFSGGWRTCGYPRVVCRPQHSTAMARFSLTSAGTPAVSIANRNARNVAITPDGTRVVYVGNNGTQLFLRALDSLEGTVLASGQVRSPFVSPDGDWVGFVDVLDDTVTLKKVAITGGPVITLARLDGAISGAT
jgi:hypothetical protein